MTSDIPTNLPAGTEPPTPPTGGPGTGEAQPAAPGGAPQTPAAPDSTGPGTEPAPEPEAQAPEHAPKPEDQAQETAAPEPAAEPEESPAGPPGETASEEADAPEPAREGPLFPVQAEAHSSQAPPRVQEGALPRPKPEAEEAGPVRHRHPRAPVPPGPAAEEGGAAASGPGAAEDEEAARRKRVHRPSKLISKPIVSKLPAPPPEKEETLGKRWYVVRVQAGRENGVRKSLERRAREEGMAEKISRIIVPTEMVSEIKSGKRRNLERKLYPGYIMVEMEITEKTISLVRRTPGVGDFVGPGNQPAPMTDREVEKVLGEMDRKTKEEPKLRISFKKGQSVKIKEGHFQNFDGVVDEVSPSKGMVRVMVMIFGRATPIEVEYWQLEPL